MDNLIKKITNTKTVISIVASVILVLSNFGVQVNNELVMSVVEAICYIMVVLGIMNDEGMESKEWNR